MFHTVAPFQIEPFFEGYGTVARAHKSVIQVGNKEGNRCCMTEHSHTYSTWLARKCAYWSGCLTSSIPSGSVCSLCFAIRASKTGPRSPWNASFFLPVANQTPTGLTKRPSKARALPPLCLGRFFDRGGAKSGHKGETMHSLGTMEMIALSTHAATANRAGKNIPPPLHSVNKG